MDKKLQTALDKWQAIQPISPRDRERLSRRFTVEFNYNSNHIEGNTLTYGQTELLLLFGMVIGEAEFRDCEEMKASNVGLKMMLSEATETKQTLKRLEQIGLISRHVYPEVPPRVEYSLTARGQSLMPHVSALIGWALEHFEEIAK